MSCSSAREHDVDVLQVDGKVNEDAAWYYATPKSAAENIKVSLISVGPDHAFSTSMGAAGCTLELFCRHRRLRPDRKLVAAQGYYAFWRGVQVS
jgi:hypothetical protein